METNKKFKCKDEVIYRVKTNYCEWTYGIFSHYRKEEDYEVAVVNGINLYPSSFEILPYEGNEELVGKTDEPEEDVKLEEGERIFVADEIEHFLDSRFCIRIFREITTDDFVTNSYCWVYAIRFSDFNPNDMEETKKHILCVKNGKVVRYKG